MKNCLDCKHFAHKKDKNGYITTERICLKGNDETMQDWFDIKLPLSDMPSLKCCEEKGQSVTTITTKPIGYDELKKKLVIKKNCLIEL